MFRDVGREKSHWARRRESQRPSSHLQIHPQIQAQLLSKSQDLAVVTQETNSNTESTHADWQVAAEITEAAQMPFGLSNGLVLFPVPTVLHPFGSRSCPAL